MAVSREEKCNRGATFVARRAASEGALPTKVVQHDSNSKSDLPLVMLKLFWTEHFYPYVVSYYVICKILQTTFGRNREFCLYIATIQIARQSHFSRFRLYVRY